MKEDIESQDAPLSEEHYDYNVGRDALTFMVYLKNSYFYKEFYRS